MKIIVFCLLFALASCMPTTDEHEHHAHEHHDHEHHEQGDDDEHCEAHGHPMSNLYKKARKVSGSNFGPRQVDMCPLNCMNQMKSAMSTDSAFGEYMQKQSKPYPFTEQFESSNFNKYCTKMNETINCVRPCSEGQVKNIANKALGAPTHLCSARFVGHLSCYDRVNKEMISICHGQNKCGSKKSDLESEMRKTPTSVTDIDNLLKKTCEYMVCFNECDRPKISDQCGDEASQLMDGYWKKSVDAMRDIFSAMGLSIEIPSVCNRVGVMSS